MSKMKTVSIFAKNAAGTVRSLTIGYEADVPEVGSILRHITYDEEFFSFADIQTLGFDPTKIKLLSGWTQVTKAAFDSARAAQSAAIAETMARIDAESVAYVTREKEKKQAVVDALLSLGTDNPALARLAQLYS